MRKLLDWIADKLGYERKLEFTAWPFDFGIPPLTQELLDDGIAMGFPFTEPFGEDDSVSLRGRRQQLWMELYNDDHGTPGKPIKD